MKGYRLKIELICALSFLKIRVRLDKLTLTGIVVPNSNGGVSFRQGRYDRSLNADVHAWNFPLMEATRHSEIPDFIN